MGSNPCSSFNISWKLCLFTLCTSHCHTFHDIVCVCVCVVCCCVSLLMQSLCKSLCCELSLFELKWKHARNADRCHLYFSLCSGDLPLCGFNLWIHWLKNLRLNSARLLRCNLTQRRSLGRLRTSVAGDFLSQMQRALTWHSRGHLNAALISAAAPVGCWHWELLLRLKQGNRKQEGQQEAHKSLMKMMERSWRVVFEM